MDGYEISDYGEHIADVYDEWTQDRDPAEAVEALARLARGGPVLELGVGTGRVALPLAARGLEVHGIDASPAMLAKLRAKPGGDQIALTVGDLADVAVGGSFRLVFAGANGLFCAQSQERQLSCFENVAAHLADGGAFVIEADVPGSGSQTWGFSVAGVERESVRLQASEHDPVAQTIAGHTIELSVRGTRFVPFRARYAWPSEIDLMARLAGLRLRARWSGWAEQSFSAESAKHVSVYERPSRRAPLSAGRRGRSPWPTDATPPRAS